MFNGMERTHVLKKMENIHYDVLIIGGGITGAGIALDAVTRGMKVALIEMQDFAGGTSSRSTKLVHGGLRYLKQFEIKVVAEVGRERAIVYENGPHVTTPEWMLLPIYKEGTFGKFSTSIGLRVYDFLAGVKKSERRKMLNRDKTIERVPKIKTDNLQGSGYYVEYRTDDARLTIEVMKKAVKMGAAAVNYAKAQELIYENKKVVGAKIVDQISGENYKIYAEKVVNATGPWVDELREKDHSKRGKQLHLTKGIHLVFDQKYFPLSQAVYFDTPDGRMIFAIPRDGKTYVGTTDTNYNKDKIHPRMTTADRDYVLKAIQFMFPDLDITEKHIESSWAGLRPLIHEEGRDPSEISRKDEIFISDSGFISIAGGKLTGYRKMAENVVDIVSSQLIKEGKGPFHACQTKHLPISGGDVGGSHGFHTFSKEKITKGIKLGLDELTARRLVKRYGSNIDQLFDRMKDVDGKGLPHIINAEVMYGIEEEMVVKPVDFFIRRTSATLFHIDWVEEWKEQVTNFMAVKFGWSEEEKAINLAELEAELYYVKIPVEE